MRTGKEVSSRRPFSTFPAQRYATPKHCCYDCVVMDGHKNTKNRQGVACPVRGEPHMRKVISFNTARCCTVASFVLVRREKFAREPVESGPLIIVRHHYIRFEFLIATLSRFSIFTGGALFFCG